MAGFELFDLGLKAGESRLDGGTPIVLRRSVGGVRGDGAGGAVWGGG